MMCIKIRKEKPIKCVKLILCISCNSDFFPQFSIYAGQKCLPKLTFSHLSQITIPFLHAFNKRETILYMLSPAN